MIAVFTAGLWRLRSEIETLTGLRPARTWPLIPPADSTAVAGWGHKPTADAARAYARRRGIPYVAFEDGFLRSVRPGPGEPPSAMVVDRLGIYYDARGPSDLEALLQDGDPLTEAERSAASSSIELIRRLRLSKYNAGADRWDEEGEAGGAGRRRVLVVDQTFGDASIAGGLADGSAFTAMLDAAMAENPGASVIAKLHPEVVSGAKRGYLDIAARRGIGAFSRSVNPWTLLDRVDKVYTVSSQFGFDALLAGRAVVCFGMPFYAGWGLTDDRAVCARRTRRIDLETLTHAALLRYCRYFDAWTRQEVDFFTAAEQLAFLRQRFLANSRPVVGYRITPWKRPIIAAMAAGPAGLPRYAGSLRRALAEARESGADILAWGARAQTIAPAVRAAGLRLVTVEDGFLRSVGLGASFTPSSSYVFDAQGIYYDPGSPNDLESLLQSGDFDAAVLARARALIDLIVARGLTKYNLAAGAPEPLDIGVRPVVLVPGQVADDQSILLGAAELAGQEPMQRGGANLALLRRARTRNPDAYLIYRPHPDVESGLREGKVPDDLVGELADRVDKSPSIGWAMAVAERVETATSLAGFEALLRGKRVAVHGRPFYAGWGLTEDICPIPRRTRIVSLEQLAAAALILYPRYLSPSGARPCPPEVAVEMLSRISMTQPDLQIRLRDLGGRALARCRFLSLRLQRRVSGARN